MEKIKFNAKTKQFQTGTVFIHIPKPFVENLNIKINEEIKITIEKIPKTSKSKEIETINA